jgi:signal transduction histidine kinase
MVPRNVSKIAGWIGGSSIALMVAGLGLMFVDRHTVVPDTVGSAAWTFANVLDVIVNIAAAGLGTLLAIRRPENRIGWLFLAAGMSLGVTTFSSAYAVRALIAEPGSVPGGQLAAWINNWSGFISLFILALLFLLFPTGRVRSRRWRPIRWLILGSAALTTGVSIVFATISWNDPFSLGTSQGAGGGYVVFLFVGLFIVPLIGSLILGVVAAVVRFVRSVGDERLQLKWFATGAVLVLLSFFPAFLSGNSTPPPVVSLIQSAAFLFLFSAIAIAILKYRLYEIDVVIGRAVVYGLLAVFITVVYAGVVVGVGTLVGDRGSPLLSAAAAAVIAIAFQPMRERSRRLAGRLVYGERATPYEVLSDFAERVAGTYAVQDVLPQTARILAEGIGAAQADVWVVVGSDLVPAGSWPEPRADRIAVAPGGEIEIPGTSAAVAVRDQGRLLGALSVRTAEEPTATERKLLGDVASQAGLVLRNVRLVEELRASRQRLVAAQDEERRKIERNLHDGVQQQLVALNVQLGLLAKTIERDPAAAGLMAGGLQQRATDALDDLRDLARGIYPPLLADQGLAAALEAQARKAPLPTRVEADGLGRYDRAVEAAVYFCALEAMNNVAKYAEASHVDIALVQQDGHLSFTVRDDGVGFDAAVTPSGTGLQGMADRLDAIGGRVEVTSAPGAGTSLRGVVPVSVSTDREDRGAASRGASAGSVTLR